MRSSYISNGYGSLITGLVKAYSPARIVEFGILDGYSLEHLLLGAPKAEVVAYDLFDSYEFSRPDREQIMERFPGIAKHGDFFLEYQSMKDQSIDIMHIDISNTGEVYKFAFDNYLSKMRSGGLVILEGGSKERDNCSWMRKYSKSKIEPVLRVSGLNYFTFSPFPSLTVIQV